MIYIMILFGKMVQSVVKKTPKYAIGDILYVVNRYDEDLMYKLGRIIDIKFNENDQEYIYSIQDDETIYNISDKYLENGQI